VSAVDHLEVVLAKTHHEAAAAIADDGAHLDEVDGSAEGGLLRLPCVPGLPSLE
jgi:hypothetical protein